jgi:glycine dehydrogenase subunit 2
MTKIKHEAETTPDLVKGAPYSLPVRRLDDVKAARELDLAYKPAAGPNLPARSRARPASGAY